MQRASGISSAFAGMEAELFECAQERTPARPSDHKATLKFSLKSKKSSSHPSKMIQASMTLLKLLKKANKLSQTSANSFLSTDRPTSQPTALASPTYKKNQAAQSYKIP